MPGDVEALSNYRSSVKPTAESRHMLGDLKIPNTDWRFCLDGSTSTSTWGEDLMQLEKVIGTYSETSGRVNNGDWQVGRGVSCMPGSASVAEGEGA